MYAEGNPKTKKMLKEWVKEGKKVYVFSPGPFPCVTKDGRVVIEGPHYPKPHTWYAEATINEGIITFVK